MSCRDRRAGALGLLAALVLTVSGCAAGAAAGPPAAAADSGVPADDVTQRIAEVEWARQCAVSTLSFADEAGITADLDARLAAVGLTHAQWKDWHDALAGSPALVAQFGEVGAADCPAG